MRRPHTISPTKQFVGISLSQNFFFHPFFPKTLPLPTISHLFLIFVLLQFFFFLNNILSAVPSLRHLIHIFQFFFVKFGGCCLKFFEGRLRRCNYFLFSFSEKKKRFYWNFHVKLIIFIRKCRKNLFFRSFAIFLKDNSKHMSRIVL